MKIRAHLENSQGQHQITLSTNDSSHVLVISPKATGFGSSTNGGELLFLALATCYCNDLYREAAKRNINVEKVEVEVNGDFGAEGAHAENVTYSAKVYAHGTDAEIRALMDATDKVAEIHNTLRVGTPVALINMEAITL